MLIPFYEWTNSEREVVFLIGSVVDVEIDIKDMGETGDATIDKVHGTANEDKLHRAHLLELNPPVVWVEGERLNIQSADDLMNE